MDFNFLRCLENAKGEYVLLFSDDDILLPGAINKIIELIEKESPDYINLNSVAFTKSINEINKKLEPRVILKTDTDLISTEKKDIIEHIGVFLTYLSATIIKRDNFIKIKEPERFYGTFFYMSI